MICDKCQRICLRKMEYLGISSAAQYGSCIINMMCNLKKCRNAVQGLTWQLVFTMWLGSASCSTGAKDQVFSHLNCNLVVILTRKPAFQHRVTEVEVTELYGELHWSICLRCNGHESLQFCVRETVYTLLCYLTDECFEIYPPPLKFPKIIF